MCFVLVEWYLNGCNAQFRVVRVTLNQQEAYDWQQDVADEFVSRQALQRPFTA